MGVRRATGRVLRWTIRVLAIAVFAVAALLAATLLLLRTDWGRERIRGQLESRLQDVFQGRVSVGAITGDVTSHFTAHGFSVTGAGGGIVIGAAEIELDYRLTSLLSGTFHAGELRLVAPIVNVERDAGGWNLRHLLRPGPPGGKPWAVIIDRLVVERGTLAVTVDGRSVVAVPGELSVDGSLRAIGGTLAARAVIEAGGSRIVAPAVVWRGGQVGALLGADVLAADATRLAPGVSWPLGDVHASAAVVGGGGWRGMAVGNAARAEGAVVFEVQGSSLPTLRGHVRAWGAGDLGGVRLRDAKIDARAAGGVIDANLSAQASGVRGTARAQLAQDGGIWTLRSAVLHAHTRNVGALLPGQRLAGAVDLEASAHGPLAGPRRGLAVRGTATGTGLSRGTARIDHAGVRFDLAGVGSPRVTGRVGAQGRGPGVSFAGTSAIRHTGAGTRLALGRLRLDTRDLTWRGDGGEVAIDRRGAVSVRDVALASEAGRVEVTGDLPAARRRSSGEQKLHIHVLKLDLGRAQAALAPDRPPIRGTVTADAHVLRSGRRLTLEASVQAARLRLRRGIPVLDVQGYAELRDDRLEGRIELIDRRGRRRLDGTVVWKDELVIDGLVHIAGQPFAHVDGTLHASLDDLLAGRTRMDGATGAAGVRLEPSGLRRLRARELTATATLDRRALTAHVRAVQARGAIDATLAASRGPGPFDLSLMAQNFDLAGLEAFAGDPLSVLHGIAGELDASLRVSGYRGGSDLHTDSAGGRVAVRKGRLRLGGGTRPLDDIHLTARLGAGRLILDELRATSGRGWLRAQGEATLDHLSPTGLRLDLSAEKVPVHAGRMIVGVGAVARVEGKRAGGEWRLTANVSRATVEVPKERTAQLQQTGPLEDVIYVDPEGLARRRMRGALAGAHPTARMRILAPVVAVRGREVRAEVKLDVEAVYTRGELALSGDARVIRGDVELFGRRYQVEHASAAFDGASPPDPRIDVRLAHEFRATTVYILLAGRARKPDLTLVSDPPGYDDAELLGFVLGGDPDDPAVGSRPLDRRAAGLASGLLVSTVQQRLEDVLPVDVLRLDLAEDGFGASRLEVGKWLTDDIYVSYRYHFGGENTVDETNQNEAAFEYRFARRWLLDAYFGDHGVGGADLLWSKRY